MRSKIREDVIDHLTTALDAEGIDETNFHVKQALQLLTVSCDSEGSDEG